MGASYKDVITCDAIPVDACHLLLGRAWHYDRHTMHDGFANTYVFTFENKRITLLPTQESTPSVVDSVEMPIPPIAPKPSRPVFLCSKTQFMTELQDSEIIYALFSVPPASPIDVIVPPAFQQLIDDLMYFLLICLRVYLHFETYKIASICLQMRHYQIARITV